MHGISLSLISVWALGCDAVSFLAKHSARVSPAVSQLELRPHPREIFATTNRRLLISLSEWPWELSPAWEKLDFFLVTSELTLFLSLLGSEISLVWQMTGRFSRLFQIDPAVVLH